jgi:hypothetical protein
MSTNTCSSSSSSSSSHAAALQDVMQATVPAAVLQFYWL